MERVTGAQRRRDNSIWERGYGEDFVKKCKLRGKGVLAHSRQRKQGASEVYGTGREARRQRIYCVKNMGGGGQ